MVLACDSCYEHVDSTVSLFHRFLSKLISLNDDADAEEGIFRTLKSKLCFCQRGMCQLMADQRGGEVRDEKVRRKGWCGGAMATPTTRLLNNMAVQMYKTVRFNEFVI
ncbi:hypothetical protein L6452_13335 [Arctium lappa]|uniref:Uncharacterized protein n=1 Tax=Arctium lappa TaxID=4217 RepID=A0ACB9CHU8_ARCLA|nr:hypothetical protein L6452_13335 [Arctium lappa]